MHSRAKFVSVESKTHEIKYRPFFLPRDGTIKLKKAVNYRTAHNKAGG